MFVKDTSQPRAFALTATRLKNQVTVNAGYSTSSYALHDSFILDSGATLHCCNNRNRFKNVVLASIDDTLHTGQDVILIEGYGDIQITVQGYYGSKTILLQSVALVLTFYTSVASLRKFIKKGVH